MDRENKYIRIPTPLKRESKAYKSYKLINLIDMHKKSIEREKKKLGINQYGMLWIQFFRGAFLAIVFERILFH